MLANIFYSCKNNKLNLSFDEKFKKEDIQVKMEVLASIPETLVYNGERKFKIPNGYGENEWYFNYKDSLNGYLRHIKTNRNEKHNYFFYFYYKNGKYFVDVDIEGANPLKKTIELKDKNSSISPSSASGN